ncbi:hypothetical protein VCHC56A2_1786, partial [Vibrio cholerae HC-56A2]
MLKFVVYKGF